MADVCKLEMELTTRMPLFAILELIYAFNVMHLVYAHKPDETVPSIPFGWHFTF